MNHETTVGEFLRDHPEYLPDVKWMEVEGRQELMLNTDALIAFTDWTIRTGRGSPEKARRFREQLRKRFGK